MAKVNIDLVLGELLIHLGSDPVRNRRLLDRPHRSDLGVQASCSVAWYVGSVAMLQVPGPPLRGGQEETRHEA